MQAYEAGSRTLQPRSALHEPITRGIDSSPKESKRGVLDEGHGQVGDVDADPVALELLGGDDGGARAAEGVEDQVALVAGCRDDAPEEGEGLLGGVAEEFGG